MEPLAIIGMACRFPGARNLEGFWRLLRDGVDAIGEIPPDRWDFHAYPDTSRWGGFLDRVDAFDPSFFGVSPREAAYMDPQQRVLLEVAWEALEDAGLPLEKCSGRPTGVFVGISTYDYGALTMNDADRIADGYANTGGALSIAANRISYLFDFRGPSMAVDTACSSSLTAAHLACQSVWRGESEVALAGGVNLILSPALSIGFSKLKAMASDGRCKTFDARADGYVRGEGAGFVVLKPLAKALRDGDRVYALVRGTALNQDGRTNGMTAPNGLSQEALIRQALQAAEVEPARVGYVEAHGTGTALGDPIELNALGTVLAEGRLTGNRCAVGSVKTNFGHLEAAAGIAGLMKLALTLHHGEIPASLHFQKPNPHIPFDILPLEVPRSLAPWPEPMRPAVGGVSSFGFGGTNVHMVLEEPPSVPDAPAGRIEASGAVDDRPCLLPLSVRSRDALPELVRAWRDVLSAPGSDADASGASLADLAYSASRRRTHHEHRLTLAGRSRPEIADQLEAFLAGEARPGLSTGRAVHGRRRKLAFVCPGQGAQWFGMARRLIRQEPEFRAALEACEAAIRVETGWSVRDELDADAGRSHLDAVDVIQPTLFAIQVALAALWRSWGVEPDAVVGHSMGEVAAAHIAGALSLDDAAKVICRRSRVLRQLSGKGAMAAVELSIEQAGRALAGYEDRVSIAVNNSPSSTVLSGDPAALEEILKKLEAASVFCRRVNTSAVAGHSPQMDPMRPELLDVLREVHSRTPAVALYSTVIGGAAGDLDLDAEYWMRNLREPVLFSHAVERLREDGHTIFVELSPHPILLQAVQQTLRHLGKEGTVLPSMRRDEDEQAVMVGSLGALFTLGRPVRWEVLQPAGRSVRLPSYPWQRERLWLEDSKKKKERSGSGHALLGGHVESAANGTHYWDVELSVESLPWLADHRVQGSIVLPASAYLEMTLAAAREAFGPGAHAVEDVEFKKALLVPEEGEQRMQLVVSPGLPGTASFQIFGLTAGVDGKTSSVLHAIGALRLAEAGAPAASPDPVPPPEVQARCVEMTSAAAHYEQARERGVDYGPAFQAVQEVWRRDGEAIARLRPSSDPSGDAGSYLVHPALLDGCFQVLAAAVPSAPAGHDVYLPVGLRSLRLAANPGVEAARWGYARVSHGAVAGAAELQGDVSLLDEAGRVVLTAAGLRLKRLEDTRGTARENPDEWLYEVRWQLAAVPVPAADPGRKAGRWILFADERGVGEALRLLLEAGGEGCVVVSRGEEYEAVSPGRYRLDPGQPEHFRQLLRDAFGNGGPACRGVVHLWSLDDDVVAQEETTLAALERARERGCLSVLHAVQALVLTGRREQPRLWLVTAGAQAVEPGAAPVAVGQSLLWGLARTITHEHPELGCSSVDLGAAVAEEASALFAEICADDREDQIALRGQARYVARLARFSPEAAPRRPATAALDQDTAGATPFRLETSGAGVLESLSLRAAPRRGPGAGEVEIQVVTAGLNFSDVLMALGLIPGLPDGSVPLGLECAGVVTAVGDGVEWPRPGDQVIAICQHGLSSHVVTRADFVAAKPPHLGFEEAITVPVAFLTAYYSLHHMGRLAAGERVLIHSASGGVGLAAVQIARRMGAEIYATAGTPEKRAFLRSLGIERISDSRSMAFADDVMEWTGGQGVDVVLNSLAGEAIPRGMALLKPGGRFLELGKRDIFQNSPLGLLLLAKNRSFLAIDMNRLSLDRPALVAAVLAETVRYFNDNGLQPLPVRVFPVSQAEGAFRHMAHGKHMGKVVLSMQDAEVKVAGAALAAGLSADATYLITGGLGGLGLVVARWLVDEGARSLVLVGRRAASPEAQAAVEAMQRSGAQVSILPADVSDPAQVAAVLADIDARLPPLRGVVHAAGVLDDGILLQMDPARLRSVMAPKVDGAWNLHTLTSGRRLDFFILFSSAAGVLGSPGQGNYAAANAFLDALAHHRHARGLPALSIDWGPWSEVGLAARPDRGGRLAAQGMRSLDPRQGVASLARLWEALVPQVSVMPVDWPEWRRIYRAAAASPLLSDFQDEEAAAPEAPVSTLAASMALADGPAERQRLVETHLQREVARVLGLAVSKLDVSQPLSTLGIDSLMAVELKNRIESDLHVSVPLIRVIQGPSVSELAALLLSQIAGVDPSLDAPPPRTQPAKGKGDSLLLSLLSLHEDERNG